MSLIQQIANGTDNLINIVLFDGVSPLDMSGVTRVMIEVDDAAGTVLDSDTLAITWDTQVNVNCNGEAVSAYPIQAVGADLGLVAGCYPDCRIRIYDGANPDGLEWPQRLTLLVE